MQRMVEVMGGADGDAWRQRSGIWRADLHLLRPKVYCCFAMEKYAGG